MAKVQKKGAATRTRRRERKNIEKGFFNGLVSARMMELEGVRVCSKTLQRGNRTAR